MIIKVFLFQSYFLQLLFTKSWHEKLSPSLLDFTSPPEGPLESSSVFLFEKKNNKSVFLGLNLRFCNGVSQNHDINYLHHYWTSSCCVKDRWSRARFLCQKKSIFIGLNPNYCNHYSQNHGMKNYLHFYWTIFLGLNLHFCNQKS